MLSRAAIAVVLLASGVAHAERVVALAPLSTFGNEDTSAPIKALTAQLEAALAAQPDTRVISTAQVAAAVKKANKPALRACEGEVTCLVELGQLVGANVLITGEIGGLGDSKIVYLGATDVGAGRELRSTTHAVGKDDPTGAVVRLLDPAKYRGTLRFRIDVSGATVYINGSKSALSPRGEVSIPVGTQAVRVTHPEYHDFVRFIDVPYGKPTDVAVSMQQYPIISRDVQGRPIDTDRRVYIDPPMSRRWYVIGGAAIGAALVSGIVVGIIASTALPDAPCQRVGGGGC